MAASGKIKTKNRARIAIVASRFNEVITKDLLQACLARLRSQGVEDNRISTVWVPGAFEIPLTALKLAKRKNVDGVICLGAVIRGQTYHFEVVSNECARGIMEASLLAAKPVILGVLTVDTLAQARARSKPQGAGNKGRDSADAVLQMVALLEKI
jgi:6,7-dimethyl-8-ribityllumazine synthase